jgi:hypothetical protein
LAWLDFGLAGFWLGLNFWSGSILGWSILGWSILARLSFESALGLAWFNFGSGWFNFGSGWIFALSLIVALLECRPFPGF